MGAIHTVVTHKRPHFDEIVALWLLRTFGNEKYPGVKSAAIQYWDAGSRPPDGRTSEAWECDGFLLVGVGGGRFDEHPSGGAERKMDECAATLVAKDLVVADDPALGQVIEFTKAVDLEPKAHPFDLSSLVKVMYQVYGDGPAAVQATMQWVTVALDAKYAEQRRFFGETRAAFDASARITVLPGGVKVVVVCSDEPGMKAYAQFAKGAHVVIQHTSSGNTQIFTFGKGRAGVMDLARAIRYEEQVARGNVVTTEFRKLEREGQVPGAECWYFHARNVLLNGSLTAQNVEPTKLSLERIEELVRMVYNTGEFESSHAPECVAGTCTAKQNPCPWYPFGLQRCRAMRFTSRQGAAVEPAMRVALTLISRK